MSPRLVALALACLPTLAVATPRLLDDDASRGRHGWLLAQAPTAAPGVSAEVAAIDQRVAELLRERPSPERVTAGKVLTGIGSVVLVASTISFIALWVAGSWAQLGAAFISGPLMVVGLALLVTGVVMWATGVSGQHAADEELATLRARREALLNATPPSPPEPAPFVPQVWRGPAAAFTVARF